MAYVKKEYINGKTVGNRFIPRLMKCTRADGTFDYIAGYTYGVPGNWKYLTDRGQAGVFYHSKCGQQSAEMGNYTLEANSGSYITLTRMGGKCTCWGKKGAGTASACLTLNLKNDLKLIPCIIHLQSGYTTTGSNNDDWRYVRCYYFKNDGTQVNLSYIGGRDYHYIYDYNINDANTLPLDYKEINRLNMFAFTADGSKYKTGYCESYACLCQVIPGQRFEEALKLYC